MCRVDRKEAAAAVCEESLRVGKVRRSGPEEKGQKRTGNLLLNKTLVVFLSSELQLFIASCYEYITTVRVGFQVEAMPQMDFKTGSQKGEPFYYSLQGYFNPQPFPYSAFYTRFLFSTVPVSPLAYKHLYLWHSGDALIQSDVHFISFYTAGEGVAHGHCNGLGFELSQ